MTSPPPAFRALVETIPVEEDASFVARSGDHGRITSRAGSVQVGSTVLTAAAIDKLSATIFPPEQLRVLRENGRVQFEFSLPGIEGTLTALAGASPTERWLEIRRRPTTAPVRVALPVAAPEPKPTPREFDDDLADLRSLDFPPRGEDSDAGALSLSDDIFDKPARVGAPPVTSEDWGPIEPEAPRVAAWDHDRGRAVAEAPTPARRLFRVGMPVAVCLVAAWLGLRYFGATESAAGQTAAPQPAAPRPSAPPAAASATPSPAPPSTTSQPPAHASAAPPQSPAATSQPAAHANAAPPPSSAATPNTPARTSAATPETHATPPPASSPAPAPAKPAPAAAKPAAAAATATPPARTSAPVEPAAAIRFEQPGHGPFSVQVGAYPTKDEADRMVTRLVGQGYPAFVIRGEGAAANFYRVRVGGYPDRDAAQEVAKRLAGSEGVKPWIAKEAPDSKSNRH